MTSIQLATAYVHKCVSHSLCIDTDVICAFLNTTDKWDVERFVHCAIADYCMTSQGRTGTFENKPRDGKLKRAGRL